MILKVRSSFLLSRFRYKIFLIKQTFINSCQWLRRSIYRFKFDFNKNFKTYCCYQLLQNWFDFQIFVFVFNDVTNHYAHNKYDCWWYNKFEKLFHLQFLGKRKLIIIVKCLNQLFHNNEYYEFLRRCFIRF